MTKEDADALALALGPLLAAAVAELCVGGWAYEGIDARFLMKKHVPVARFRCGEATLCFIITPNDPAARVFRQGARFSVTYYSDDVADEKQSEIYRRDKPQIERVAGWVCALP